MNRKFKAIFTRLGLVLGSLLITLIILEIVIRIFWPQQLVRRWPDIFMPVEGLGHVHAPNLNTTINTGNREVRLITDEFGYRIGPEMPGEPAYRVLALGDSFLEAFQVEYEDTFSARLEAMLMDALGDAVRVVNTGVSGWNPNHYWLLLNEELSHEDYDLVVVFVYLGNDIVDERVDEYLPRQPARRLLFLEEHSHLVILAKNAMSFLLARLGLSEDTYSDVTLVSSADWPQWTVTANILNDIATNAEDAGVPALFVLLPSPKQVDETLFESYRIMFNVNETEVDLQQPNRLITAELEAYTLNVFDTTDALQVAYEAGETLHGRVDQHFEPIGHRVVAQAVFPVILQFFDDVE